MKNQKYNRPNYESSVGVDPDDTTYYGGKIKKLALQFMAIFTDMHVQASIRGDVSDQSDHRIKVPIFYGRMDSVVASILSGNTRNRPFRLPVMAANITAIAQAHDRMSGVNVVTRATHTPLGGMIPNDTRVVNHMRAIPHYLNFDLHILTSNTDHQWQIMEHIMLVFGQPLQIQTSTDTLDPTAITDVTLEDVMFENNWPIGTDARTDLVTIRFRVVAYLAAPPDVRDNLILSIKTRVGAIPTYGSFDTIADQLDAMNIEYDTNVDVRHLEI